ncbi:MAG: hypothetical protein K6F45_04535 [Saccharofermentans sp.]|nr:hypothetical protein [Saccharofermentans sp.]
MTIQKRIVTILLAATLVFNSLVLINNTTVNAATDIALSGTCHVQDYGDTAGSWDASTGILTLGTRGQSKRVEAITINLENNTGLSGTLEYRVHVQDIGWQDYRTAGEMAGTSGQAKRLEGIEMNLTGDLAACYTVEYAVHIEDYGDAQGFVSDGALAGTTGEAKRLEEVRVRIIPRGTGSFTSVNYRVHRQDYGWESSWAKDGAESGTTGQSKRLEGIEIHLTGNQYSGSIEYHTHVQNIGWEQTWSKDGEMSGTQGMSYRLEGIEIKLTGDIANYYDVYYRVHAQDYGWLGWAKNGEMSGTSGMSKRLEAIQIVLVAKGGAAPGNVAGVTSVMIEPAVINGIPTSASGSASNPSATNPAPATTPSSNPSGNAIEHSYKAIGNYEGISFAIASTYDPYYERTYQDYSSFEYVKDDGNIQYVEFGLYVSEAIDRKDLYFKLNGDEGFRDIGDGYAQLYPDPGNPVAYTIIQYYDDPSRNPYMRYGEERAEYMLSNGYSVFLDVWIYCALDGEQSFDLYYKDNKITTISVECTNGRGYVELADYARFAGNIPDRIKSMCNDISQYKDNMTDLETISACYYWIANHSYHDNYTCWTCSWIRHLMMTRGYPAILLSCSYVIDGQIVNQYSSYYSVSDKNRNENSIGHRIALVFISPTEYVYVQIQGSMGLASGQTDFSTPWVPQEVGVRSVYTKVSWLRDYDTVYDMVLGDYGVDLATFDPYDCSTWYS